MKLFLERARSVIVEPKSFFEKLKNEDDRKQTFLFLFFLLVVSFLLNIVGVLAVQPMFNQLYANVLKMPVIPTEWNPALIVPSFINTIFSGILGSLLLSVILYLWLKLFSKKGTWMKTFNAYVYSSTPVYIFGWLPIVNFVAWVYSIYLLVLGIEKSHQLERKTAALVIVIPTVLLFLVSTVLTVIAFSTLR